MGKPLHLLIVEDAEDDALLLVRHLRDGGFEPAYERVDTAETMRAALAAKTWDVILCDYKLPRFSVPAALALIQKAGLDLPFIVVSGTIGEEKAVDVMKAGIHDLILKDNLARLVPAIERELAEAEVRRERKEAEAALRESEERSRLLLECAGEAIYGIDLQGNCTFANPQCVQVLGHDDVDALLGKNMHALIHHSRPDGTPYPNEECLIDQAFRKGENVHCDTEVLWCADGSSFPAEYRSYPIRRDGDIVGAVVTFVDITERKQSEEALKEKTRLIQLLQTIAVAANEAATVDETMQVCLDAVCAHTGWPVGHVYMLDESDTGELVPTNLWHLDHPEGFKTFQEVTDKTRFMPGIGLPGRVLASGEPAWITDVTKDPNFPRAKLAQDIGAKAGLGFPVMVGKSVVGVLEFFSADAVEPDEEMLETLGHVGTQLGRVVERERAEKAEAQLRQSQKMEAVGQLTGGVAHDFNNLLTVILGNLQLLERQVERDERLSKRVRAASDAALRGAELTKRLLAYSRRQVLEPEVVDLNELVAGMDDLLRRTLGEATELKTVLAGDLWSARVDLNQLESALLNLAINARDAMPQGGMLTIETGNARLDDEYTARHRYVTAGPYVLLAVSDTGTGMSLEVIEHAFEPFFTTKEAGQGSGLGLSMVYGFVKQSGGHVNIYSEEGGGTTVKLYLPRATPGDAAAAEEAAPEAAVPTGGETILVVEDDAAVREIAVALLGEHGYRVLEAEDGPAALSVLDEHPDIDLLLTDVVMPGGMSGPDLARKAKARRPKLKVLYTSGYTENAIIHGGGLDEGVEMIGKPYRHQDLARKIRHVLESEGRK